MTVRLPILARRNAAGRPGWGLGRAGCL